VAGYTPAPGKTNKAPVVTVQVLDMAKGTVLKTLFTSEPLGAYSYDNFTGYSPPIEINAQNLNIPNDVPVVVALQVANNDRTLHIPIDDLAAGLNMKVRWSSTSSHPSSAPLGVGSFGIFVGAGQVWAKRQPGGASAVLVINTGSAPITKYNLDFKKLNLTSGSYEARDIWARKDLGSFTEHMVVGVPPYDSAFMLLSPKAEVIV